MWYQAKLTPAADGIFTSAFYPPNKLVAFTIVNGKAIVVSNSTSAGLKILTGQLAQAMLEPMEKIVDVKKLDSLSEILFRRSLV